MSFRVFALAAVIAAAPFGTALSQQAPLRYCAHLGDSDHVNSKGARLADAAAILRQDRANFHSFGLRDYGDQTDERFATSEARSAIPDLLRAGRNDPAVLRAIVAGTPDVCIEVSATRMTVVLAPPAAQRPVAADRYPFEGRWDCEVAVFSFTPQIYDNGSERLPIREIQEGSDGSYTLFFDGDYLITLSGFTATQMGWLSHESGDSFQCRRLD